MIEKALMQNASLFRPIKPASPTGVLTYVKTTLRNVKIGMRSSGVRISSAGETQRLSGVLYFNEGWSSESPALSPLFQSGDMITDETNEAEPPQKRFVVLDVQEHSFKGKTDHYEVVLV